MFHRIRHSLTPRTKATLLLLVWAMSLLLPVFHFEAGDGARAAGDESHGDSHCSRRFAVLTHAAHIEAICQQQDCHDPFHHHHPIDHHDPAQCPLCSSVIERLAELPSFVLLLPEPTVAPVVAAIELLPAHLPSVVALARGPPAFSFST